MQGNSIDEIMMRVDEIRARAEQIARNFPEEEKRIKRESFTQITEQISDFTGSPQIQREIPKRSPQTMTNTSFTPQKRVQKTPQKSVEFTPSTTTMFPTEYDQSQYSDEFLGEVLGAIKALRTQVAEIAVAQIQMKEEIKEIKRNKCSKETKKSKKRI